MTGVMSPLTGGKGIVENSVQVVENCGTAGLPANRPLGRQNAAGHFLRVKNWTKAGGGSNPSGGAWVGPYPLSLVGTKSARLRFPLRGKLRPLPCASSPNGTRCAGLPFGGRLRRPYLFNLAATTRAAFTPDAPAWAKPLVTPAPSPTAKKPGRAVSSSPDSLIRAE